MHSISSELLLRRTVGDGVWASSFPMSVPACICETSPRLALIRFLISVVSCCWNVINWPEYLTLSLLVKISILISSICISFFDSEQRFFAENFRLSWVDPETHFFSTFLEFVQHFLKLILGGCEQKHVVGEPQVCEAVVVVVAQVDSHSFFSFASAGWLLSVSLQWSPLWPEASKHLSAPLYHPRYAWKETDCLDDNIVSVTRYMVEKWNSVNFFVAHKCVLGNFARSISCFWCVTCNSGATLCFTERPLILPLRLDGVLRNWSAASHHHSLCNVHLKKWLVHLGVALLCSFAYSSADCKNWAEPWCCPQV